MHDAAFTRFLAQHQQRVERLLDKILPDARIAPQRLHQAMRHAALGGGKRIRPLLTYATGRCLGVDPQRLDRPAAAIELIHAYSLVHDDLPAMDDDTLRHGKPSCHAAFGEASAMLAGDALQSLAFHLLARTDDPEKPEIRLQLLETLAHAAGSRGMAGGQQMDIDAVGSELSLPELENMHIHKTGALICASVRVAALVAEIDEAASQGLGHYAKCIGLAFQVYDDILDIEGETEELGKTQGKDQQEDKPTYPRLLGLDGAREMATRLVDDALESLSAFDHRADALRGIARYIVTRRH